MSDKMWWREIGSPLKCYKGLMCDVRYSLPSTWHPLQAETAEQRNAISYLVTLIADGGKEEGRSRKKDRREADRGKVKERCIVSGERWEGGWWWDTAEKGRGWRKRSFLVNLSGAIIPFCMVQCENLGYWSSERKNQGEMLHNIGGGEEGREEVQV